MYSLVIPVYKNEDSIPDLIKSVKELGVALGGHIEAIFVVDGSPDACYQILHEELGKGGIDAQLLLLSRNFGAFSAVRAGLEAATGNYFAVMAADLQEPPSLIVDLFKTVKEENFDVGIATREQRNDPFFTRMSSHLFWAIYRRFIQRDLPSGGVDIFSCNEAFRRQLLTLKESNSSLIGLLFWVGFRRKFLKYTRLKRVHGKSAWTLKKKLRYLSDSVFAFSDLPVRLLFFFGTTGLVVSIVLSVAVLIARISGAIYVPGYAALALIMLFFGALNLFGIGIVGSYVWRAFENTKGRPQTIVMTKTFFKEAIKI